MSGAMNPKMMSQTAGIAPSATDQKAKALAGWEWPPMILNHRAQKATKDATEKNGTNGRIRIIRHASVTAVIRTKSATGQSRMIRSTRIVQNGTSIEGGAKLLRRRLLRPASNPLLGPAWVPHDGRTSATAHAP